MREVMERLIAVWGAERVSIRLSPNGESQGVDDSDPASLFAEAARVPGGAESQLCRAATARSCRVPWATTVPPQDGLIRQHYTGPIVLNSDYTPEGAAADVASGRADAISFGRPDISNPDLVERIRVNAHLAPNVGVPQTWYFPGEAGYIDYPTLAEETAGTSA